MNEMTLAGARKNVLLQLAFPAVLAWGQGMAGGGPASIWPAAGDYAGSKRCALCHASEARSYPGNSMSRASEAIQSCQILARNPRLTWSDGPYRYVIEKSGDKYRYAVTDGARTAEATLLYALGQGKAGQTYVYEKGGQYYESRVSYYQQLNGLALTVGAQNLQPENIDQALGRMVSHGEARDCFGCHTTGARRGNEFQLDKFENGVECEDCHGPGADHANAMQTGKHTGEAIRPLTGMTAEEANELCGSCHRTWDAIMLLKIRGTSNVRFQPYRLTNSPCFSSADRRIACTACHNPHQRLVTDAKAYDSKCQACHNAQNAAIAKKTCKVATEACVSCHMPRYEVPGSHHAFADHWIRVVKAGERYPD
jgi:hypothetical protein